MKIWIDTRVKAQSQYYENFVYELIEELLNYNSEHHFVVYIDRSKELFQALSSHTLPAHITLKEIGAKTWWARSYFSTKKVYEIEKFHMMVFFDAHSIPHRYTRPYIVILESLKDVFFPKKKWLERKLFTYKLKASMRHCYKCICLDSHSPLELNEHLNISEENIAHIPGFFPKLETQTENLEIDVRLKHNLKNHYLIYDSWNEVHNNFERILKSLKKLKEAGTPLNLIITCDATSSDLDIREKVIEYKLSWDIIFLWSLEQKFEASYYKQSHWVIFSSVYESFPFQFTKALHYKKTILANDIRANREVMDGSIIYLDPLSVHAMTDTLSKHRDKELADTSKSYTAYLKKYNSKITLTQLLQHLES